MPPFIVRWSPDQSFRHSPNCAGASENCCYRQSRRCLGEAGQVCGQHGQIYMFVSTTMGRHFAHRPKLTALPPDGVIGDAAVAIRLRE